MNEMLDPQAIQLNDTIRAASPAVMDMLSERGRKIFFPKLGILSQAAAAKGKDINATIGTALENDGSPMCLPSLAEMITLPAKDVFPYAPSPGLPEIRKLWADRMLVKNPTLAGKVFSKPVVTCALTHGLSMAGYLFCDDGDTMVIPDLYWENYDLLFEAAYGAQMKTFPTFTAQGGFNIDGMRQALLAQPAEKLIVSLNFPNNPTGYTPLEEEVPRIKEALLDVAESGKKLVLLIDDAYFGLVFEDGVHTESGFAEVCDLHRNILAVKLDGPTKEDYVWGFRVGFITFGVKGGTAALYEALEAKCAGAIRGTISNAPCLSQSMLLEAYKHASYEAEKQAKYDVLKARYQRIREILAQHPEYAGEFAPLPFNSGYFMCVKPVQADPEKVRQILLNDYSTGVISLHGVIRLAFSSTPLNKLETLFANLYAACKQAK